MSVFIHITPINATNSTQMNNVKRTNEQPHRTTHDHEHETPNNLKKRSNDSFNPERTNKNNEIQNENANAT